MISGVIHGVIRPTVRATLSKGGGGVIATHTVMRDSRVMRDSLRMTDRG